MNPNPPPEPSATIIEDDALQSNKGQSNELAKTRKSSPSHSGTKSTKSGSRSTHSSTGNNSGKLATAQTSPNSSGKSNSASGSGSGNPGIRRQTVRINEVPPSATYGSSPRQSVQQDGIRPSLIPPRQTQMQTKNNKKISSSEDSSSDDSSEDEARKKQHKKMMKNMRKSMQMQQQAAYYNYCQQQAYQGGGYNRVCPENLCMTPMKSAAFIAQNADLLANGGRPSPKFCCQESSNGSGDEGGEDELEDGVAFSYKPRANGRTEMTVTVEPKKQPWLTMMRFGFRPVVNCTAPPCYLSPSNAPGLQFQGGQPGLVNNAYSHYNPQMQQRPFFPALNDIRKSFNQRRRGQESSSSEDSENDKVSKRKNQKPKPNQTKTPKNIPATARKSKVTKIEEVEEVEGDEVRASIVELVSEMGKKEEIEQEESLPSLHSASGSGSIE